MSLFTIPEWFFGWAAKKVLNALGIVTVTYGTLEGLVTLAQDSIRDALTGLPDFMLALCGMMGVDTAINILFAGISARLSISILKSFQIGGGDD